MKETPPILEFVDAAKARDAALEVVAKLDWMAMARAALYMHMPYGVGMIGEELRLLAIYHGLPTPNHHNAWGALIMFLRRSKPPFLKPTGVWRSMRGPKSHARASPEYVRT